MRIVKVKMLASLVMALACADASASGGLSCHADDTFAAITIESGVTRGMGSPVFNFRGTSVIRDDAVAGDLRSLAYDGEHLAQYWLDRDELRVLIYRERAEGDHGFVEIEVRTSMDEEGFFKGSYQLTAFDMAGDTTGEGRTVKGDGPVECFVE